ncbi:MAG: tetratricopeptide repeat protein [Methanobacteriota archaeon]
MRPARANTDDVVRERLRANADDPDALFVLAALHARDGHVAKGLHVLDRVLRIDPKYPGAWVFKAKLHRLQGDPDAAARAERRAEVEQP